MNLEIERKFLVNQYWSQLDKTQYQSILITQGYLSTDPKRVVRIHIADKRSIGKNIVAEISIKSEGMLVRAEYEYEIPLQDAEDLLKMSIGQVITKRRYFITPEGSSIINWQQPYFEVDVFEAPFPGLIIAEIELPQEDTQFQKPLWLGQEVTMDTRYYNAVLAVALTAPPLV